MTIGIPVKGTFRPVTTVNENGRGSFVLLCDHASNFIPEPFDNLGLTEDELRAHIAWDPGALGVSLVLSHLLDAPLVYSNVSRLIIDCNRQIQAPDLIPEYSEATPIPGNQGLSAFDRENRIALSHAPFHEAVETITRRRITAGRPTAVVSLHSYTPVYNGESRPWQLGLIYNTGNKLAKFALMSLREKTPYQIGDNEPYSPEDGVYYTLNRHGTERGLNTLMIEIRNNEITDTVSQEKWARLLAPVLADAFEHVGGLGR